MAALIPKLFGKSDKASKIFGVVCTESVLCVLISMKLDSMSNTNLFVSELYFLIGKFLSNGPLQNAAEVINKCINILTKRNN